MSAAQTVLPIVYAVREKMERHEADPSRIALYRKYTEGMLRRYLRLSMEARRVST